MAASSSGNTTYQVQPTIMMMAAPLQERQLTQQLITSDKVNFLLGPYGTSATCKTKLSPSSTRYPWWRERRGQSHLLERVSLHLWRAKPGLQLY